MTTLIATMILAGQGSGLSFIPTGITAKLGGYRPVRAVLSNGTSELAFGAKKFKISLSEPEGQNSVLKVDSKGDGHFVPAKTWAPRKQGNFTMMFGAVEVEIEGKLATVSVYKFDKTDPQRAALKDTLLYYPDFGFSGKLTYGAEKLTTTFAGYPDPTNSVFIDRNGNGKSDGRAENFSMGKPFNIGGTTYEFQISGASVMAIPSTKSAEEIPLPPDLTVGKIAPGFEAESLDGNKINFPGSYKGKIVFLDFWATWCGPCIAELPNLIKGYEKFHSQGIEVLGVSLDQPNKADTVKQFTLARNMPWPQIYEGKYWDIKIGKQYGVQAIPFCLLVDGDTGKILATVNELRGNALDKTLSRVLAARR